MNLTIKNSQHENISYCVCLHTCLVCSCTHKRSKTYSLIVPLSSDVTGCCNYLWPTSRQWFLQDADRERQPPLLSSTLRRSKWISKYLLRTSRSCVTRSKKKLAPACRMSGDWRGEALPAETENLPSCGLSSRHLFPSRMLVSWGEHSNLIRGLCQLGEINGPHQRLNWAAPVFILHFFLILHSIKKKISVLFWP